MFCMLMPSDAPEEVIDRPRYLVKKVVRFQHLIGCVEILQTIGRENEYLTRIIWHLVSR